MRRSVELLLSVPILLFAFNPADAAITIGAGSVFNLADAIVDVGCQDVVIAGQAGATAGSLRSVDSLSIAAGGNLAPGAGDISLGGDFNNAGGFVAGTSRVAIVDACGHGASQVLGATSFHDFFVTTTTGKQLVLPAGQTQTVARALTFEGAAGALLNIVSSSAGVPAVLAVDAAATQTVDYVNARDNTAIAAGIAPGTPAQYHSVDAGGLTNWFGGAAGAGTGATVPAPLLNALGRAMLLLGLVLGAMRACRAPRCTDSRTQT